MAHSDEPGEGTACNISPHSREHRQQRGFIRAMARELLVHNSQVNTIDEALQLAETFTTKTWDDARNTEPTNHEVDDKSME